MRIDVELSSVFEAVRLPLRFSVELKEHEATVTGLLHRLCEMGGDSIKPFLFEEGTESVLSGLMVMVNDRVLTGTSLNQGVVELHEKDRVNLMYFISGG